LGIGDVGVPKRMKKLAKMFYGRTAAYDDALERNDRDGLTAALARNVRPDVGAWPEASLLANYVTDACNQLAAQTPESIVSGALAFPVAKGGEQ
jgi:cytochrome b pre-mRNA-processing protein 3